ncbi:MAG TPA: TolC family protein [Longimicrobium sp.]|nr:TolC family protein [Longimicrobium sp.]
MRILPFLLLALAAPLAAQTPRPLTLDDAVRAARENNPAYRRVMADVASAEADVRQARGAYFPEARLSLSTGASYAWTATGRDEFGQPVTRNDGLLESQGSNARQTLSLGSFTLFDGGVRKGQVRAARASVNAARAAIGAESVRARGEVGRRYWTAVRAERGIRLEAELLASARERVEVTQRLMRVAVRGPVDVLGAEATAAEQEGALERARGEHRKALLDLRQEMGTMDDAPLALVDAPPAPFDPARLDAAALVAGAVAAHPLVMRAEASVRAAEERVRAARAGRWPTLGVSASAGRDQYFSDYTGLRTANPRNRTVGLSFDVGLPLFDAYRTSATIARARASSEVSQADVAGARLAAERDVRAALIDLENAFRSATLADRTLALNRQRVELAQQQYRVGGLAFPELQDATEAAARAERDALSARFEFATALASLEERAGTSVAPR